MRVPAYRYQHLNDGKYVADEVIALLYLQSLAPLAYLLVYFGVSLFFVAAALVQVGMSVPMNSPCCQYLGILPVFSDKLFSQYQVVHLVFLLFLHLNPPKNVCLVCGVPLC